MSFVAAIIGIYALVHFIGLCRGIYRIWKNHQHSKGIHERFTIEERLCTAAQKRGDWAKARQHLDYMRELHESHRKP